MSLKTYEGVVFDYSNPTKEMINIKDILRSLPRLSRFVGHSTRAYSVGEHSILCYFMAHKLKYTHREQLLTLIHDFTEAYVGDCPAPLKKLIPEYSVIEEKVEMAIYDFLGIKPPTEEEFKKIKRIDMTMLVIEMRDFTVHDYKDFINDYTYEEMLEDEDFRFNLDETVKESEVRDMLEETFEYLMKKVK